MHRILLITLLRKMISVKEVGWNLPIELGKGRLASNVVLRYVDFDQQANLIYIEDPCSEQQLCWSGKWDIPFMPLFLSDFKSCGISYFLASFNTNDWGLKICMKYCVNAILPWHERQTSEVASLSTKRRMICLAKYDHCWRFNLAISRHLPSTKRKCLRSLKDSIFLMSAGPERSKLGNAFTTFKRNTFWQLIWTLLRWQLALSKFEISVRKVDEIHIEFSILRDQGRSRWVPLSS